MSDDTIDYSKEYSETKFWSKVKKYAKVVGKATLGPALTLYYCASDRDTPLWAKSTIVGALGYFISPIDAIPDMIPVVGYADDAGVLLLAFGLVVAHIKPEHRKRASDWFDG